MVSLLGTIPTKRPDRLEPTMGTQELRWNQQFGPVQQREERSNDHYT